MSDFNTSIDTPKGLLYFTFTGIHTARGVVYFVAATGMTLHCHFHMEERVGMWRIIQAPKPPDFIIQYEV